MRHYKRFAQASLDGMRHLTMEQRAVYNAVIDLIHADEEPVTVLAIATQFSGAQRRKVIRIINELLDLGKLDRSGDRLTNIRAEFEIQCVENPRLNRNEGARRTALRQWRADWLKRRANGELNGEKFNEINAGVGQKRSTGARARGNRENNDNLAPNESKQKQTPTICAFDTGLSNDSNGAFGHLDLDLDSDIREKKHTKVCKEKDGGETNDEDTFAIPASRRKPSRPIPDDWTPPAIENLTPLVRGRVQTWHDGEFDREREKFVADAHSEDRRHRDWNMAFGKWLLAHDGYRQRQTTGGRYEKPAGFTVPRLGS